MRDEAIRLLSEPVAELQRRMAAQEDIHAIQVGRHDDRAAPKRVRSPFRRGRPLPARNRSATHALRWRDEGE